WAGVASGLGAGRRGGGGAVVGHAGGSVSGSAPSCRPRRDRRAWAPGTAADAFPALAAPGRLPRRRRRPAPACPGPLQRQAAAGLVRVVEVLGQRFAVADGVG